MEIYLYSIAYLSSMAKPNEKFRTYANVFDAHTLKNLFKLSSQGHFEELLSPLCVGKEANVFSAVKKDGSKVCIKIYRLETCDFNRMYDYMKSDPRFKMKRSKRHIIFLWAQREFRNLLKARDTNIKVPTPYALRDNILIMELIGKDQASPQLKDKYPKDPKKFFEETKKYIRRLYKKNMVHGDLSSFNILNKDEKPIFIDFSQATILDNPNAEEWLRRDVKNICKFFAKLGIDSDIDKVLAAIRK